MVIEEQTLSDDSTSLDNDSTKALIDRYNNLSEMVSNAEKERFQLECKKESLEQDANNLVLSLSQSLDMDPRQRSIYDAIIQIENKLETLYATLDEVLKECEIRLQEYGVSSGINNLDSE